MAEKAPIASQTSPSQQILKELKGLFARLKLTPQPIRDGHAHLVPFCESLEAAFRDGLKQPNSWWGFNKQDYWCWIEPLQDYYFNQRKNPLFSQLVNEINSAPNIRSLQGRGRSFIRAALRYKLITVPIEHLVKNIKLTQYWYHSHSIIGTKELRENLMEILFQTTELDFDLDHQKSSFLDETWVIPIYKTYRIAPIKTLDTLIIHIDKRELIVAIDDGCLVQQAGVEVWDIIDKLCGVPVNVIPKGRLQKFLAKNSVDYTEVTVVKKYLPDGTLFGPVIRRQLAYTHHIDKPSMLSWLPELVHDHKSSIIQTKGESTEYTLVYLGKSNCVTDKLGQALIDDAVSQVLNDTSKPEVVVMSVGEQMVSVTGTTPLLKCGYQLLGICGQSTNHQSCLALLVLEGYVQEDGEHQKKRQFACHVCEAPTSEFAHCLCSHIAKGFGQSLTTSSSSS